MEETSSARPKTRGRMLGLVGAFSLLLAQLVFSAGPAPAQVPAPVLYGADGGNFEEESSLYKVNPATGAKTETIGDIGFAVTGLAFDPTTGDLYGVTASGDASGVGFLIKIDVQTGQGTAIGPVFSDCDSPVQDITFTTTGQLFGWTKNCAGDDRLVQINKATGKGTALGASGLASSDGNGLSADPDDNTLWLTPDDAAGDYGTVNATTGVYTSQGTLTGATGDATDNVNALAWTCDGETLFGSVRDGFLISINTATDTVTVLGHGDPQQDALAWDCAPPPPVVMCKGQPATITGTSGSDVLTGTTGRDVVAALGGNDRVSTLGGNDLVCAGGGKDRVNGGGGKDRLLGQGANDRLRGAGGNDRLVGGGGRDRCNGGPGTDKGNCEIERNIP